MTSFQKLWEAINESPPPVDQAQEVIRSGIGIRENFWQDFILLLNNSKGLSDLLDVPVEKISTWNAKITAKLQEVDNADTSIQVKKNKKLIKTGKPNEII